MRTTLVLLAMFALGGFAVADPPVPAPAPPKSAAPAPAAKPPEKPLTPEQAADAVFAAVKAKDDAALKTLSAEDAPDPWLVADELIRRGEFETAAAFAKAAPRVDIEQLPAYVASRRGKPDDPDRRARLQTTNSALAARRAQEALDTLGPAEALLAPDVIGVRLAYGRGVSFELLARPKDAAAAYEAAAYEAAARAADRLGWLVRASLAFGQAGLFAQHASNYPAAIAAYERARAIRERRSDLAGAASTLGEIGIAHYSLGDFRKAISAYERALSAQEAQGDREGAARTLGNLGVAHYALGDFLKARSIYEYALVAKTALGDGAGAAATLGNLGLVHFSLGDFPKAMSTYERALAAKMELGDEGGAAATLGNIGLVHDALGDFAKALSTYERALATQESVGDRAGAASTLGHIGSVWASLDNFARALSSHERALAAQEALGDRAGAARTLGNIGNVHAYLRDYAKARSTYERALEAKRSLGDERGAAQTLGNIGNVHALLGDFTTARSTLERALAAQESLGDRAGAALTLGSIGDVEVLVGSHADARSTYERSLAAMEALGDKQGVARTLSKIAGARCRLGDWAGALDAARHGVALVPFLVSGLGDEEGATARGQYANLFSIGAVAGAEVHDVASVFEFIERGRAGSLLEALGARAALQSGLVPPELAAEEAQARAKETCAANAYRGALGGNDADATRVRRLELDAAQAAVEASVGRIQREAKKAASVVHFQPDDVDTIRRRLAPDEALVLYGLFEEGPLALVVTATGVAMTRLATSKDVEAACAALLAAIEGRTGAVSKAADALRDLVIKPLGLSPAAKRLLISPDGALSYVPFALLAPDRETACVASGTTYRLLLEDAKTRGDGVLALGDPDYEARGEESAAGLHARGGAGHLTRLPATADEAKAIGWPVLLGRDATEKGLREAVARKPRWRSVHLACHGIIDAERPGFSSLALTPGGDDDGFLTVLEVFRSKIPADLVVMSACETARGKTLKGEGIMGLTRAFMFAGAPRVICSLWPVDDAATRALMTEFYELWNPRNGKPGLPAATALRQAQEYIRTQGGPGAGASRGRKVARATDGSGAPKGWSDPYYWAAWVLWGLPS